MAQEAAAFRFGAGKCERRVLYQGVSFSMP